MLAEPMPFPPRTPAGFTPLLDEPCYDPRRHLALEKPVSVTRLAELGYDAEQIATCPSDLAITAPFRLLSNEGVEAVAEIARRLEADAIRGRRVAKMVRGGVYRSRFLRHFARCPNVADFLSGILGAPIGPHTMPLQLAHLSFAPEDPSKPVDKWQHDTVGPDYVLMLTDPGKIAGGEFQWFRGTKAEAAALTGDGKPLPDARIVSPKFPGAGWAVFQQGNMVVHRGAKLRAPCERITLVNAYVPLDIGLPDPCRFSDLRRVDPPHVLYPDWARHKAWLARGRLDRLIAELPYDDDKPAIIAALKGAAAELEAAIADIADTSEPALLHYGE
ncbi:MAG: hypothetical protein ACREEE_17345 [Dongiaceae bacterium]